jgi:hypothetical protein
MKHLLLFLTVLLAIGTTATIPRNKNAIRQVDFKNFVYPWEEPGYVPSNWNWISPAPGETVRLINGESRYATPSQKESEQASLPYVRLSTVTYGDLDGDGNDEAAVVLNYSTGGTANWSYLYIYKLHRKVPKLLARLESGSRADGGLVQVSIEDGVLVLDFADHDRRIGDCCSKGFIRVRYRWHRGGFVETGPQERGDLNVEVHQ